MSDVLDKAAETLVQKLGGADVGSVIKFVFDGEGAVVVDATTAPPTASVGDGPADVTVTASVDVFQDLLTGALNPTAAYMSGKLKIDGDLSVAMKLSGALA